ncbi:MAG: hypothetical protein L6R40_003328 [Gallowayella cf. fulva]|nr:MAG: hypothetical protein L6R40_003328 [Xanthomendoza cf. fulva]
MRDPSDGVYLLDRNDHPILDWPELPLTISGQVEGLFLELWYRLNRHITTENMLARCPALTQKAGPKSHRDDPKTQIRPLPGISAYGNRRERHRLLIGTCAWDKKEGSASIQAQLKRVLPNSVLAELEQQGTTRTWRDLSNQEVNAICYVNKGQGTASLRAGNRRLTDEKKKEVDAKKDPVLEDTFEKLLQEKRDLDALDQETAHTRATNAGSSNVDPAAGVIHEGPEILTENDTHINLQYSENEPGQRDGATMFEQFVNEFDDTLVQDPWPQQTLATPKESGQRLDDTQGSVHQTGNKELEQPIDFRYEYPRTREQEYSITMALVMTRQMFRSVTGEEPPVAPKGENYMGQWLQLQYHFKEFYLKNYPGSPIPWLPQQPKWHDDWNGWELQDQNFVASGNEQDGLDLETHVAQTSSAAQKGQASNPYNLNPVRAYNEAFDASAMALQTPAPGPMAAPGSVEVTAVNNDTKAAESSEENGHGNSLSGPAQSSGVENSSKSPSIPGTADPWAELDTLIEEANAMAPKLGAKQAAIGGQLPSAFQEAPWNDFDELIRNPNFLAAPYRDTSGTDNLDPALTIMLGNPHDAVLPAASNDIHNSYPASTNTLGNPRDAVLPAASNDIEDTTTALPLPKATSPQAKFVSLSQLLKDDSQPVQYHDQPAPDKEDDGEHSDANSLFGGGLG